MARFTTNGFDYETEAPVPFAPIGPQPAKASRTTKSKLADTYTAEEQARIGITDDNRNDAGIDAPCSRCVGSRYFHCWRNIEGGRCFRCGGTGTEFLPMDKLVRTARRNALARADAELNGAVFAWNAIAAEFATIHADRAELAAKHARVQARRAAYVPGHGDVYLWTGRDALSEAERRAVGVLLRSELISTTSEETLGELLVNPLAPALVRPTESGGETLAEWDAEVGLEGVTGTPWKATSPEAEPIHAELYGITNGTITLWLDGTTKREQAALTVMLNNLTPAHTPQED